MRIRSAAPAFLDPRVPVRTWSQISLDETGCWSWLGDTNGHGYGLARVHGKRGAVHRLIYGRLVESLPPYSPTGPQLDHLCKNRRCVNPTHLEVVTPRENTLRGDTVAARRAAQTHCIHGHEFTPENTIRRTSDGTRGCKACQRSRRDRHGAA